MTTLFKEVTGDALPVTSFELDRAQRSLGPKPAQGSRPFLVRFHRYIEKERVLLWAKKTRSISYQGHPIRMHLTRQETGIVQQSEVSPL